MVMFKKIVFFLLIVFIFCTCFYIKHATDNDGMIHLQFASWGSESEIKILKPIISDFEKQNPQVKIDFMHIPQNYFQKIHLLFASNTSPDIIFINNQYLPIYANAESLEGLSKYLPKEDLNKFYPKSLGALSWKGEIYALPRDVSNLVIYYNKDIFDKYNVPYPHASWTYENFLFAAQKITHLPEVFGVSFEEEPLFFLPYMTMYGGWSQEDTLNYFNYDVLSKDINYKGLSSYSDLRNKYHVAPLKSESASATMAQMFLQERLGMHISGRWLVPKYRDEAKFDWDVVEFPRLNSKSESVVPLDASGWAISKSSKYKKESIKFVKYLASKEVSEKFTQSGLIVPARVDVSNSIYFLDSKKPKNAKAFITAAETAKLTPVTLNYREILDNLKNKAEYMFNK